MRNVEEIGRDDWIRTSDPLNPISKSLDRVTDYCTIGCSRDSDRQSAHRSAGWTLRDCLPIVLVVTILAVLLELRLYLWLQAIWDQASQIIVGPFA